MSGVSDAILASNCSRNASTATVIAAHVAPEAFAVRAPGRLLPLARADVCADSARRRKDRHRGAFRPHPVALPEDVSLDAGFRWRRR